MSFLFRILGLVFFLHIPVFLYIAYRGDELGIPWSTGSASIDGLRSNMFGPLIILPMLMSWFLGHKISFTLAAIFMAGLGFLMINIGAYMAQDDRKKT